DPPRGDRGRRIGLRSRGSRRLRACPRGRDRAILGRPAAAAGGAVPDPSDARRLCRALRAARRGTEAPHPMTFPPVLMLHHVEPEPLDPPPLHSNSYLSRREFGAFLDQLRAAGYQTATLAEACLRKLARRTVVLTFDDGCRCFAEHAWPELAARGMTATLFPVSGELGGTNRWDRADGEREERLLDGPGLAALARDGVEIGCHGRFHRDLALCSDA